MLTHTEIIKLWPSIAEYARDIDVGYQAAHKMSERNSIHSDYWEKVVYAAKVRGYETVTLGLLAKNKKKRKCQTLAPQNYSTY